MRTIKQFAGYLSASTLVMGLVATVQPVMAEPKGIANTLHNLGSGNLAIGASSGTRTGDSGMGNVFTTGTDEICVFCHTPHGANTDVPAPLWNKGTVVGIYTPWWSTGMNGTAPSDLNGHQSLACLSCHDGTQAMDDMVNGPGGGAYATTGASPGYTWYKNNDASNPASVSGAGAANVIGDGQGGTTLGALAAGANIGANSGVGFGNTAAGYYYFSTDISANHPVGMPYGGGNCTAGSPGSHNPTTTCNDTKFYDPAPGLRGMFEVGSGSAGAKSNFRIYGTNVATATVECGSCHDPHSDVNYSFMRKPNQICATCHNGF